jgi:hypothetical protein
MTGVPYPLARPPFAESGAKQLSGEKPGIQGRPERAVAAASAQADLLIVARTATGPSEPATGPSAGRWKTHDRGDHRRGPAGLAASGLRTGVRDAGLEHGRDRGPGHRGGALLWALLVAGSVTSLAADKDGTLPSGGAIARAYGRQERWGRLVKNAGLAGAFGPENTQLPAPWRG